MLYPLSYEGIEVSLPDSVRSALVAGHSTHKVQP